MSERPTFANQTYFPEPYGETARLRAEIERLRSLLADKKYIAMKAKHNAGQHSWANMLDERKSRTK